MLVGRIPNLYILVGLLCGIFYRIFMCNERNYLSLLISILLPVLVLFPLFAIRAFGAGDLKLLAVTGAFLGIGDNFKCFAVAIAAGGLIGIGKLLVYGNFQERFRYFSKYVIKTANRIRESGVKTFLSDKPENGYMSFQNEKERKKACIHFALPILIGSVFVVEGLI